MIDHPLQLALVEPGEERRLFQQMQIGDGFFHVGLVLRLDAHRDGDGRGAGGDGGGQVFGDVHVRLPVA
jgi:hypothetical protein